MKFALITHVNHTIANKGIYAYAPYVREMNIWFRHVDEVFIVAPMASKKLSAIDLQYEHPSIKIKKIYAISLTSFFQICRSFFLLPSILRAIFITMHKTDHIHLRCPGNIGLLGCMVQIFFPKKTKTAKYAGNWDPQAKQPLSYRFQKWILSNTFLTRNMTVLVYGEWEGQTKNIKPFFTASYPQEKSQLISRQFTPPFNFLFIGTLSAGKRPLYAIKLVEGLMEKGMECYLDIYGDGAEDERLKKYVQEKGLEKYIGFNGNQASEVIENAYKKSDFLVLPSKSEGWPKVVAEAMFWGVIPLATKISCVPWMLDYGKRGILLETDLPTDVKHLSVILRDTAQLERISKSAQLWSQKYTLDSFEKEIKKLL